MKIRPKRARRVAWGATAFATVAWAAALSLGPAEPVAGPPAGGPPPAPRVWGPDGISAASPSPVLAEIGADSITPLADVAREARACGADCLTLVYAWTPRMPLSRSGIPNVLAAARELEVRISLVAHEELQAYAQDDLTDRPRADALANAILDAGVLAHAPALVVLRGDAVLGTAILGYKSAEGYAAVVSARLAGLDRGYPTDPTPYARLARVPPPPQAPADYEVVGVPGAYFRWVPYTRLVAYESDDRIYLLDLADGQSRPAPGFVDFVPTPDGRYFVTPGASDEGLVFFDAKQVVDAVDRSQGYAVRPIYNDPRMRDQYPSVGILQRDGSRTRYRVLTSWFEGLRYQDYDVVVSPGTGASSVRPVGEPVVPCRATRLSTPIMSQSGREVAARDESTGTTKIFEILDGGACRQVQDLGAATSKVAWHASGRKLAFSTPRRGTARGEQGIFVFDRDSGETVRVPTSEGASALAFPDFVGESSVVFLLPAATYRGTSYFRVVDGVE
ncbi:MAG: hypothetical protein AB7T31_03915 [Gemmatimonadales bacterium]